MDVQVLFNSFFALVILYIMIVLGIGLYLFYKPIKEGKKNSKFLAVRGIVIIIVSLPFIAGGVLALIYHETIVFLILFIVACVIDQCPNIGFG